MKRTFEVTIDNTGNKSPFHCNFDNHRAAIVGGQVRCLISEYPILITFDRGDGGQPARNKLSRNGTHKRRPALLLRNGQEISRRDA